VADAKSAPALPEQSPGSQPERLSASLPEPASASLPDRLSELLAEQSLGLLPEHYFRHESARLISTLARRFGVHRVELCEDAVQTALLRAVQLWSVRGSPHDKSAWLYRVALNDVLGVLRREKRTGASVHVNALGTSGASGASNASAVANALGVSNASGTESLDHLAAHVGDDEAVYLDGEVKDDELRMLFVCANPAIPHESQLVFALKILCGFSTEEIALRLFQSNEAIYKRLQRARATLREHVQRAESPSVDSLSIDSLSIDSPGVEELASRLPAVLEILYLLFTEGYSSAQPDQMIRRELCEEAIRLARLLDKHPVGAVPETAALLALIYLDAARFDSRVDGAGGLLLLEEQDRSRWDQELIRIGMLYLQRAARGDVFSRYHAEAGIAAEHCLARSFEQTRWGEIVRLYEMLDGIAPSPINTLNRAIAIAEWKGPEQGLALLETLNPPSWLLGYYLWDATLGELYRRRGDRERATAHLTRALDAVPTQAERALLLRRLEACSL
jgi:RNA polymerase sigma factor (sigma-70 family)